jgi:large subunit ribosomal protein L21
VLCLSGDDGVHIGKPNLAGATVTAEVLGYTHGPKLVVQKLRKRKNSRRKTGHRQLYTTVKINKIVGP